MADCNNTEKSFLNKLFRLILINKRFLPKLLQAGDSYPILRLPYSELNNHLFQ